MFLAGFPPPADSEDEGAKQNNTETLWGDHQTVQYDQSTN